MGVLSVALVFIGYTLVYAATANHGQFATEPWAGVFGDAYPNAPAGPQGPQGL